MMYLEVLAILIFVVALAFWIPDMITGFIRGWNEA
jgi:hypothetical protein